MTYFGLNNLVNKNRNFIKIKHSFMDSLIMKGRGNATNVPELELIEQVRIRPVLYDKNVKDYRKPNVLEYTWAEVADALQANATNCRKRWKSLRDTFIKYYRLEVMNMNSKSSKKIRKDWIFYKNLSFLMPHVDLYRLDNSIKSVEQATNNSVSIYLKTPFEDDKQLLSSEEGSAEGDETVSYHIKIAKSNYEEEHLAEFDDGQYNEELLETEVIDSEGHVVKMPDDEHTYMLIEQNDKDVQSQAVRKSPKNDPTFQEIVQSSSRRNTIDPDERYLLSCLPAFKRLTPQQKARIRIGIEKLFYEVEFESENEPLYKKFRRDS